MPMPPLDPAPFTSDGVVHGAWTYPLFDAILQRRARRFPLGATMPSQGQAFVSPHTPLPLDPVEEALLIMVGTGVSGVALVISPLSMQQARPYDLPFCPFSILAQVSRNVTVRLNTSAPGRASRSTQK